MQGMAISRGWTRETTCLHRFFLAKTASHFNTIRASTPSVPGLQPAVSIVARSRAHRTKQPKNRTRGCRYSLHPQTQVTEGNDFPHTPLIRCPSHEAYITPHAQHLTRTTDTTNIYCFPLCCGSCVRFPLRTVRRRKITLGGFALIRVYCSPSI